MSFRAARRAVALGFALLLCILRYWAMRIRGPLSLERRAEWLQSACRIVLSSLGVRYRIEGQPPQRGVVVSNHLSYLDIAIFSAAIKCFFVSKAEVGKWPYFGWASRTGGTIFIDRSSILSAKEVAGEIGKHLALPVPLLFFPEGTSTDGSALLRFHSGLFEPAVRAQAPITAAAVRYVFANGAQERELCWFGDEGFLPHLWKALGASGFTAVIRFGEPHVYPHRRAAAQETHDEVAALRKVDLIAP